MVWIQHSYTLSHIRKSMNKENKFKLKKAINFLKDLHFKTENIMVTGSMALDLQGLLPEGRTVHDVDFIIKMDDQTWRCLKLLEAIYDDGKDDYYYERKDFLFFNVNGLVLNIWRCDGEWSDLRENKTGVYVATAEHIINTKKNYGRTKDFKDINEIVKKIL